MPPNVLHLLAERGVTFSNAFTTTPVCAPGRASLLTGRYARHTGVLTNFPPRGGASGFVGPDASTIATWLQGVGYRTGIYGKYLNAYLFQCPPYTAACYQPPGWDEWDVFLQQSYYDYQLAENGRITAYGHDSADYSTDRLAAQAVEFVRSAERATVLSPFRATCSAYTRVLRGHPGRTARRYFPRPHSLAAAQLRRGRRCRQAGVGARAPPRRGSLGLFTVGSLIDATRRSQLQALQAVDEAVAALVVALRDTGQDEDTVIVYTSDNGLAWGEHRWSGKLCEYESCLRVPLIISNPQLGNGGRVEPRLALNIDLAPTLAALAQIPLPGMRDGSSLLPLLQGRATAWRTDFVLEYWRGASGSGAPAFDGLRTANAKSSTARAATPSCTTYRSTPTSWTMSPTTLRTHSRPPCTPSWRRASRSLRHPDPSGERCRGPRTCAGIIFSPSTVPGPPRTVPWRVSSTTGPLACSAPCPSCPRRKT